jgi:WD40 repeat protein
MLTKTASLTLNGHGGSITSVAFSPDGQTVVTGSLDKTVKLWSVADGTLKQTLNGHADSIYSVAFSPDGQTVLTGSADDTAKLWNVAEDAR